VFYPNPEDFDYRVDTREVFERIAPQALVARASEYPGALVLWDPLDDEYGFLVVANDREELLAEFDAQLS
jgi:hypothetical protein